MSDPTATTVPAPPDDSPFWDGPLHGLVRKWLRANNIEPQIPRMGITVTGPPGERTIHYRDFVRNVDGHIQVDPNGEGEPLTEKRATPCLVEPPAEVTGEAS
ncbi:hypothetical protein ACFYPN_16300 [Streptomyces sp. NPDC005576]|uniref:hypothetical protein n=1 Tax=Streptomyces sp. NPDC005576 TaxID=3364726 RepID=UPI00368BE58E